MMINQENVGRSGKCSHKPVLTLKPRSLRSSPLPTVVVIVPDIKLPGSNLHSPPQPSAVRDAEPAKHSTEARLSVVPGECPVPQNDEIQHTPHPTRVSRADFMSYSHTVNGSILQKSPRFGLLCLSATKIPGSLHSLRRSCRRL